jgi:hypothetical protein
MITPPEIGPGGHFLYQNRAGEGSDSALLPAFFMAELIIADAQAASKRYELSFQVLPADRGTAGLLPYSLYSVGGRSTDRFS